MSTNLVLLPGRQTQGDSPAEVITATFNGFTGRFGRRTLAHLQYTQERLTKVRPGAWIRIIQGCYSDPVRFPLSAGTHNGDGVLDVEIVGWEDWLAEQGFLRSCGWSDWWRHSGTWADPSDWHHHMVSIGCPGPVGEFVPGQVDDYYRHTYGLKNQHNTDLDKSWFPGDDGPPPWPVGTPAQWKIDIDKTVFDFVLWEEEMDMSPEQEDRIVKRVIDGLLAAQVGSDKDPATVKQALNQTRNNTEKILKKKAGA